MKQYYVFLDESGDFDKDLEAGKKLNPSLVGGFFCDKDTYLNIKSIEDTINNVIKGNNHATEMQAEDKGMLVLELLSASKKYPVEFVIFQNGVKKKIINSTQTYLTVITEGLVQLMKTLAIKRNESIELNVVAGFKKDATKPITNSYIEGYVEIGDYQSRIEEKLAIEKAKLRNPLFQNSKIKIQLADDKKNTALVLSDYICNFWYTRQAKAFSGEIKLQGKEVKLRAAIKSMYDSNYIFNLFNSEEDEHVIRMIQDGCYSDALFEMCAGMLSEKNESIVRESFLNLPPKQIGRQLSTLADYIGDIIIFKQAPSFIETVLTGANALYLYVKENKMDDKRFYLDVQLYLLAFYNNTNQLNKMEAIFEMIKKDVADYTIKSLNLDYLLIYYTRSSVYLLDMKRYNEACNTCEEMEILLGVIEEDIRKNDFLKLEGDSKSEQLGKILGTKLQAQIGMCYLNSCTYEEAKDTSDRAMSQFTFDYDLFRQYQYRAELEAVCGNQESAIDWLEKSFSGKSWKEHISSSKKSIYDIYNLLYVAAMTKHINHEASAGIANHIFETCKNDISKDAVMESICMFYMGYALKDHKKYDARGVSILKKLIEKNSGTEAIELSAAMKTLNGENGLDTIFKGEAYGN